MKTATVGHAIAARDLGFTPHEIVTIGTGEEREVISFPFVNERGGLSVMAREPGDPTTMLQYDLPDEVVDLVEDQVVVVTVTADDLLFSHGVEA